MQENEKQVLTDDESQYKEFKRIKRMEEAKASILKIESDFLSPLTDKVTLKEACKTADSLAMGAIVVLPAFVKTCVSYLGKDPKVSLIAAISFPHGADTTDVKVTAVKCAVKDGVDEVEVCAPSAVIKEGNWSYFKKECKKLKKAAKMRALRITFDCVGLGEKELIKAATVAADASVNCLRLNGADGELIAKVKTALKGKCLIKASGAENAVAFANLNVMGADYVSCTFGFDTARYLLRQAETEV